MKKTKQRSHIHAVYAQNEAPLCCLKLLFEIDTTNLELYCFFKAVFLFFPFFSLNGNNDLFLLPKEMVLEQTTPVFMFVF